MNEVQVYEGDGICRDITSMPKKHEATVKFFWPESSDSASGDVEITVTKRQKRGGMDLRILVHRDDETIHEFLEHAADLTGNVTHRSSADGYKFQIRTTDGKLYKGCFVTAQSDWTDMDGNQMTAFEISCDWVVT